MENVVGTDLDNGNRELSFNANSRSHFRIIDFSFQGHENSSSIQRESWETFAETSAPLGGSESVKVKERRAKSREEI